jgi:hypothetical protein
MTQPSAAITAYLGGLGEGASILLMLDDLADLFEQGAADGTPVRRSSGRTPRSSPRRSFATTRRVSGSPGNGNG